MSYFKNQSDPTMLKKLEEKVRKQKQATTNRTVSSTPTYNDTTSRAETRSALQSSNKSDPEMLRKLEEKVAREKQSRLVKNVANLGSSIVPPKRTETRKQNEEKGTSASGWEIAGNSAMSGLGTFNKGLFSTLDFILPTEVLGKYDFISNLNEYYANQDNYWKQKKAESVKDKGTATKILADLGEGTVAALPNAVLALMTAGSSAGATTLGTTTSSGAGWLSSLGNTARTAVKNPMYWTSMAQTLGTDYEEAKANGANDFVASASAIIKSGINAGIEIGGGIETLPNNLKSGDTRLIIQWVTSMVEEGNEEVVQGVVSGVVDKMMYDHDKEAFSLSSENAIVNPQRMAKEFGMGAAVGGILGGAQTGVMLGAETIAKAKKKNIERNDFFDAVLADDESLNALIEEGKASGEGTVSAKIAEEVEQAKANGNVTREQVKKLIVSNEEYINAEEKTTAPATLEDAARDVVEARKRKGTPLVERLEEQSKNNEPITVADIKKATGFGEEGSKLVAEIANSEGVTFSQAERTVKTAYMAGFADVDSAKVNFETDTQIDAFTAGKKDMAMKRLSGERGGQTLERDLIEQGVPLTDRRNIIQAVSEIEGSLAETKHSISSVVSGVRKITNNLAKAISQKVGNMQNLWGLLHTNLKALQSDTVSHNRDLVSAYTETCLDTIKNNESGRYNEISAGVRNVSGALTEYLVTGIMPEGVQNKEAFLSVAEDIADIVRMAEEMLGNAREQLYGNKTSLAEKDVLQSGKTNGIIETSAGAKVSYALDENVGSDAQPGVMWTIEEGILTKKDVALFYQEIAKLNYRNSRNYQASSKGEYIFDIENKLIYTDGDYSYPMITKVISFDSVYEDDISFAKELILNEEGTQSKIDDAIEIIEILYGQGFVIQANIEDSGTYARQVRGRKGTDGRETHSKGAKVSYALDGNATREKEDSNYSFKENNNTYTYEEYRSYGWARANEILTAGQNEDYRSKFAMAKSRQAKFPKTKNGEYIIPVSDIYDSGLRGINNVLVFAKGTIDKPIITSVIEIYEYDETELDKVRRNIYELERRGIQQKVGGVIGRYYASDFGIQHYREYLENSRDNNDNGFGGRDSRENSSVEREQSKNLLSDDGGKRKYSKSSGRQARKVDGRSRRYKEGRETARKRRERCQALKDAGHTRKRVILGHSCEVIPEKHYDSEMTKLVKENEKNGIDETILVVGSIELPKTDGNGRVKTAKGMFIETADGRKIVVVQCDNEYYSPKQINDHELVHNDYGSERTLRVKNIILKTLPIKMRNELLGIIQDDYSGMLEDLEGDALEELVANILSGMHYLSNDFLELSKAYWNKDDAFIKRWEYEVSKKSFAKEVEKGYASEMRRINRQLAYDEYVQLREYIMDVNNRPKKLKNADCTEIGNNFYIWRNKSKTDYEILFSIPIEGNTEEIEFIRGEINAYNRREKGIFDVLEVLDARYGNDNWSGSADQDIRTRKTTLPIYKNQSKGDRRGNPGESNRDTSGNRIKYVLDKNGMWEMEHIFENDDPEAEAAMMRDWKALLEKYGAIPKGENPARDIQVPKKTAKDKKVSQTVRTILEAKATPDEALPTIEKMVEDGVFSYDVYTDKQAIADAETYIKEYGWDESLDDWFNSVEKGEVSKQTTTMGWALYNNAANIAATTTSETERTTAIKTSLKILDAMVRHQRSAAQALQATRILKKLSPETQLYGVQKSVEALQKELADRYGDKAPELKIDEDLAEQFLNAKTEDERAEIEKEIYKDIGRQMPSRFIDKWNAWRYLAMLGNLRTHIRNIVGNAFFVPVVVSKDLTATAIESAVYRASEKKTLRGKALIIGNKTDRKLLEAAWDDFDNVADLISNGGKYNDSAMANQHIEEGRQIFQLKPLEWARKKNSALLEIEDMWFSKPHYAYALAQYCKANHITAEQIKNGRAIAPAREYAIKEAQKATYRDTNAFSQMVSEWGRNGNDDSAVKKSFSTAIEGILPFRKTPANILVRGVEYSPLGLLKGLSYDLYQVSKGKMSATEAIDNISAGLTGTGLLALGVFLAAQGIIRGHGEEDKEEKEFKELMGQQAYALELPNGQSITLDWLAPEALPFFVGVNLWESTKGSDEEANLSAILQAVSHISEPMLEMSCLQSLNDLFESVGYATSNDASGLVSVLSSSVTSYLMQGLPTLLGQAERTGKEHRMTTYTEKNSFLTGDMQYMLGKASSKIPLWDYNQIPYIDAWGRKEASGTALKRGLNNFLNPSYTSTIDTSKMEEELLRLFENTGERLVFPSRADKYFTVDGKRKDLTADEYVRYATLKGEKSYKLVSELVTSKAYKNLTDEEKAKAVKEAYDYANQKAKQAISNYKPETWINKADEFGSNVGNYISFKTNVNSTKEDNGGKISKQEVVDIILDMAQNDSETWNMYLSMYESNNDLYAYNKGIDGETYMYFLDSLNDVDKPTKSGKYGTYTQEEAERAINQLEGLSRQEKAILWQSVNTSWKASNNPFR